VAPDAGIRLAPQALVYTPTTAETSITSEVGLLTVPAPPVPPGADSFEVPDASEAAEEPAVAELPAVAEVPVVAEVPAVAEVPVVAEVPPVTEVPGIAQDSVLSGVGVTVQSTASLATEILATATRSGAEAPREPAPLVISEDLTLISRNRKRRLQFRVR
jgi:fused signal recognition particle receptor